MSVYLATFVWIGYVSSTIYVALFAAAVSATAVTNLVFDRGRWPIGIFVSPLLALRDFVLGAAIGAVCIVVADFFVFSTASVDRMTGHGFPWRELLVVFIPAAVQEELVFRGYLFQKARAANRPLAIGGSAVVFAWLHTLNGAITAIAIVNLAIAGVLLALAYELFERLWLPIGLHLAWNVISGPILGWDVSGYSSKTSVFGTTEHGPSWLTGGRYGLEGSVWVGIVELAAVAALLWSRKHRRLV